MEDRGNSRQRVGKEGERIACDFLAGQGHIILERNFRLDRLEIDIISLDADGIHFVEVKTRQSGIQAPPQENVGNAKQRNIATAARRYLKTAKGRTFTDMECMFDVIAITMDSKETHIEWFPQAYIPMYL